MATSQQSVLLLVATLAVLFTGCAAVPASPPCPYGKGDCAERPGYVASCEHGRCVYVDSCTLIDCPSLPFTETTCTAGKCISTCLPEFTDCNQNLELDGCEINTKFDIQNCGGCGLQCEERPGFITSCDQGVCTYVDECTVFPNCGGCGVQCEERPGFISSCDQGVCTYIDACAVTLCIAYPNAITTCKEGLCSFSCAPGYADCNQDLEKDGCEVNVYTDKANCNGCGNKCPGKNSVCSYGTCQKPH